MTITDWIAITAWEGTSVKVMARVYDVDNALITQAALSTVKYRVVTSAEVEVIALTALTISSVVFDTLQTASDDASWVKDETGFNFKFTLPITAIPTGGTIYHAFFEFTDTASRVSGIGVKITARETYIDTPA